MRWDPRRALRRAAPGQSGEHPARALARLARVGGPATEAVETVGFWAAVALPLGYVPLLLSGLSNGTDAALLTALVVLHLAALSAGHTHNRE